MHVDTFKCNDKARDLLRNVVFCDTFAKYMNKGIRLDDKFSIIHRLVCRNLLGVTDLESLVVSTLVWDTLIYQRSIVVPKLGDDLKAIIEASGTSSKAQSTFDQHLSQCSSVTNNNPSKRYEYHRGNLEVSPCVPPTTLEPLGEPTMSNVMPKYQDKLIADVTLVKGKDVEELTESDFFHHIREIQKEIKSLEVLPESSHVQRRIEGLNADLSKLVELMDVTLSAD